MGDEVAVAEGLQIGQEGGGASIDDHLVQHSLVGEG
jgi:hypothetical protein